MDTRINAAIVDLGERLPVNLEILARKLNSLQSSFTFSVVQPITAAKIGDPDIEYEWHELERLFAIIYAHPRINNFDYMIGITHLKVTCSKETIGLREKSYFSLSDFKKVSVISVNRNILKFNSPAKNEYQYAASCMIGELLMNLAGKDLCHSIVKYCLFDLCEDRSNFRNVIDSGQICPECVAELERRNVSKNIINGAYNVLKWCKRNSMKYSLILAIENPITLLSLGTGLGWLTSSFLKPYHYPLIISSLI